MSLVIYTAHSGGNLEADGKSFASVDELRKFLEQQTRLPPSCQILMTARGTMLRPASLTNETTLYLYDRKLLELNAKPRLEPIPKLPPLKPFPDDLENETEISSWRLLFKKRKSWAETVVTHAEHLSSKIREADSACDVILRSVTIAFTNLDSHSKGLHESSTHFREWAEGVMQDRERVLTKWESAVKRLLRIPVHEEFRGYGEREGKRRVNVLVDFVEVKDVQKAGSMAVTKAEKFEKEVVVLGDTIGDIVQRTKALAEDIAETKKKSKGNVEAELGALREDIEILGEKVRQDYEYARGLQGPKSASMASKRAYSATTETLPALVSVISDMGNLLQRTVERKNDISALCLEQLQHIAVIQSVSAPINNQINALDTTYGKEDPQFELLSMVMRLPSLYGSLLIECVRRREWSEKFSGSSQRLAEELALMKEDEEKRRRKWHRATGALLPFDLGDTSQIVRTELSTRGDPSGGLPQVERKDVENYIQTLRAHDDMSDTIRELTQAFNDLDRPVKRINRRLKGFKMGSVHEADMMNSSFMGGNNHELESLRAEKLTLGDRIKGYESRIRKLEDLLHRGRASSGNAYQPNAPGTPTTGTPSQEINGQRPASHRRTSSEAVSGFDPLAQRVNTLETELAAERDRNAQLQKQATAKVESEKEMNARITEADDTKRDLVANLEATVQQHVLERKALQTEINDLKAKIEETNREMDQLEESRSKYIGNIHQEMEKLKEQHQKEIRKITDDLKQQSDSDLRREVGRLTRRADEETQRADEAEASLNTAEKATSRLAKRNAELEKELKEAKEAVVAERKMYEARNAGIVEGMRRTYSHLALDTPDEDLAALMTSVEDLVSKLNARNKDLMQLVKGANSKAGELEKEKTLLQQRFDARTIRVKDLTQRLYTHNARSVQLLETLGYRVIRGDGPMQIVKVSRNNSTGESTMLPSSTVATTGTPSLIETKMSPISADSSTPEDINLLYWMETSDSDAEGLQYSAYLRTIGNLDLDAFTETLTARVKKCETDARTMMKHSRVYRDKYYRSREEATDKIAFKSFKPGDLALFLPTRNQITRPWAAFNVGAPHFFLRETQQHKLASRDWLLARITKIEEKVVDLSRSRASMNLIPLSRGAEEAALDDDNPFELSDGLRWYMLDAVEEKPGLVSSSPGAPATPGAAASTVAAANVDAKGSLKSRKPVSGAKKKLSEITTVNDRRSSGGSSRNSAALSTAEVAAVRAAMQGRGDEVAVESAPGTPVGRPGEKTGERGRAASVRGQQGPVGS